MSIENEYIVSQKTLNVNFFGGACTTKSTQAYGLSYELKLANVDVFFTGEVAKPLSYEQSWKKLLDQPQVTADQLHLQFIVNGIVDVCVTDSPILLGNIYKGFGYSEKWENWSIETFNKFNNLNIYMARSEDIVFNQSGRNQDLEGCKIADSKIKDLLDKHNIPYTVVLLDQRRTMDVLFNLVAERLDFPITRMPY